MKTISNIPERSDNLPIWVTNRHLRLSRDDIRGHSYWLVNSYKLCSVTQYTVISMQIQLTLHIPFLVNMRARPSCCYDEK